MTLKQAVKSIIFIIIFIYILISVTYMIRTNGDVKDRFTGFYAEPDNTIDMVMIGSSPVYPYYSTPQLWGEYGITAYPISTNLQRPVAAPYLVEEVRKTQNPSLYVFEMRMYTAREGDLVNNMAYTRGVTDNMKYSWNRIKTINAMVEDKAERYTYYFDIFKYHSNWKTIVLPKQMASFRYELLDERKGYVPTDEVGPCEAYDTSMIEDKLSMPAEQEEHLYELLDYLKKERLQALFILSPTVMEEEKQMMYNYMEDIIESYGYEFLNMNNYYEEIGIDFATDFSDYGGHTNALGAEKCTVFLADYIQANYSLADRRGNKGYETWDAAYEQWKEEAIKAKEVIVRRIENGDFAEVAAEE
ncbi:SGNH/GDSL hydrolase family protein [Kineothrix sp. MB12-C1]|uniref:SGNH/GDSL hydrolase family protein n=1 Tax=Kineothrix sp. MB12-C1 TaxID=3070215 RepID=UPI0027D2B37D|nr:SGNH/GDSL hydrolase family protein [Kineothrix sp. MB12-C1]WMC91661.1 SGNH/GDSL hydrolase family protein [Kineothrix sp. MB12-C1]